MEKEKIDYNEMLPEDVRGKFNVKSTIPGESFFTREHGDIDLRTMSVDKAEMLLKNGFEHIEAKVDSSVKQKATPEEKKTDAKKDNA